MLHVHVRDESKRTEKMLIVSNWLRLISLDGATTIFDQFDEWSLKVELMNRTNIWSIFGCFDFILIIIFFLQNILRFSRSVTMSTAFWLCGACRWRTKKSPIKMRIVPSLMNWNRAVWNWCVAFWWPWCSKKTKSRVSKRRRVRWTRCMPNIRAVMARRWSRTTNGVIFK